MPGTTSQVETLEEIAERYVADLPPSTDCAFNVAKKGQHRFCSRMGRERIGSYYFCRHHANVVAKAVLEGSEDRQIVNRINEMIDERLRITDDDFKSGLPPEIETRLIERMSDMGYTIGMDEDGRNEWWPPEDESQP